MKLRDLSDLELAALASMMHEAMLGAVAMQGFLAPSVLNPWPMVQILHGAARAAGSEAIARRAGEACAERLFPEELELPLTEVRELRELMKAIVNQARSHGFHVVAALLEERLATEIRVDVRDARHGAGVELRTLN